MSLGSRPVIAVAFLLGSGVTLAAQGQTPSLEPGTRMRLTVPCPGRERAGCRIQGTLVRFQADSIAIALAESTTSYGLRAISRVEVSRGRRSHRLLGAGAGFLIGTGAALLVLNTGGSTSLCNRSANQDAMSSGACLGLTALGGVAGAGLGVLVGGLIRTERWQDLPLDRLRLSLRPQGRGAVVLTATVAF